MYFLQASFDLAMMDEAKLAVEDLVEHYKSIKKMDYITKGIWPGRDWNFHLIFLEKIIKSENLFFYW